MQSKKFARPRSRKPRLHKCLDCGKLIRWAPDRCYDCYLPDYDTHQHGVYHDPLAWRRGRSGRKPSIQPQQTVFPMAAFEQSMP